MAIFSFSQLPDTQVSSRFENQKSDSKIFHFPMTLTFWSGLKVPSNDRAYIMLSMLIYILQKVNPKSTFTHKFQDLLKIYPEAEVISMGFSPTWEEEVLWQE